LSSLQGDIEKGLEMKKLVLSGFLASEEIYINQLEALLLVRRARTHTLTIKDTIWRTYPRSSLSFM
jgi:hypothetical protein